jgi:hypothetical protein
VRRCASARAWVARRASARPEGERSGFGLGSGRSGAGAVGVGWWASTARGSSEPARVRARTRAGRGRVRRGPRPGGAGLGGLGGLRGRSAFFGVGGHFATQSVRVGASADAVRLGVFDRRRRDSRHRCLVFGRVRATPCSSARALWRARALEFSLAPKRSLTSCPRTFGGHSFLFFHNYGVLLVARPRNTATSDSPTRAQCPSDVGDANFFPHARSRHHHTPTTLAPSEVPRTLRCDPRASCRRRLVDVRHTTHVRVGAMPLPP